jgi:AcrR family transcriptional regulator
MNTQRRTLLPRKKPIQARSSVTVEAIFDACIQILLTSGRATLTTTRVAERAGVSVGTLYQYFPNKDAMLAAVLERHLLTVVTSIEAVCMGKKNQSAEHMVVALVEAFFEAKFANRETSLALYELANDLGGTEKVALMMQRSQLAVCELLATAADARFSQLSTVSFVLLTALVAPVQALMTQNVPADAVQSVKQQIVEMLAAYLRRIGEPK